MEHALRDVVVLGVVLAVGVGPVGVLIRLLNRRDRREAALFRAACAAFSGEAIRSDVAIRVRGGLVTPRSVVIVDMRACSPAEFWEAMTQLRRLLPPSVRLRVEGTMGRSLRTRLTVDRVDVAAAEGRVAAC